MNDEYWIRRDGTKIKIDDMDIGYLRNTLKMIIRNSKIVRTYTFDVAPFSQSEVDAITGGNAVEDIEPYCDDYLWK